MKEESTGLTLLAMVFIINLFTSLLLLLLDYDAPLSEAGDITKKYTLLRELLKETVPHSIREILLLSVMLINSSFSSSSL